MSNFNKDITSLNNLYTEAVANRAQMDAMLQKHPAYHTRPKMTVALNDKLVDKDSIVVGGVSPQDAPEFANAYFTFATFDDGTELQPDELDQLTDQYGELLNDLAAQSIHG